jgi:putative glycosyltransferase (TIGR04372 family)
MNADFFFGLEADENIPIQAICSHSNRLKIKNEFWEKNRLYDADLVLSGNMISENMLNSNEFIHLSAPKRTKNAAFDFLEKNGLDLSRWFACVYWKEPNYIYRNNVPTRTIFNNQPYIDAIDFIINELGGQVVRLGHFNSSKIKSRKSLIDLTLYENITGIEVHAANQARFIVATASGPMSLGHAFGVPTLACDSVSLDGVWDTRHYMLTQSVQINDDKYEIKQKEAYDLGLLSPTIYLGHTQSHIQKNNAIQVIVGENKYILRKNNSIEIINGIKEIYKFTEKNKNLEKKIHIENKINKISLPFETSHQVIQLIPFSKRT